MTLRLAARAVLALVLCNFVLSTGANGQDASANLKEIQVAKDAFSAGDPVPSWVEPVAIPDAKEPKPVIVRLADSQYLVGDSPVAYVHRAILINDAASLTSAGQLAIQFVPQYQQLRLHAVQVLRAAETQDRTASSTIRFLQRETNLEQGVYSGIVTVSILVNDLRVGDTVEFSYSLYGQNPVFGGKFVADAGWDQSYPTLLRRVVLNYPDTRKINWRIIGDVQSRPLVPDETAHEGIHTLRFEQRDFPEIAADELTPPDYAAFRVLQFSEFSTWNDVVIWASGLFQTQEAADDEISKIVEKLRQRPTTKEQVTAALEFVQSEIRYFSVSLGESSHRPTQPNVVLQRRYGDCKDKSFLLMTLLKRLGVESEPVLLSVARRKGLDKFLPSPQLFDHAIVRAHVDGGTFYLDPTRLGEHGRLDRLGQVHEDLQVLVISSETRGPSTIISPNALDLVRSQRSEVATLPKLSPAGTLKTSQTWVGASAESIRVIREHLPHAQFVKLIGDAMEARYPGAILEGEPQIEDDQINNTVSIAAAYNVPRLAIEREGTWIVRFSPVNLKGTLLASPTATRTAPLIVPSFPFEGQYTFEVRFPNEINITSAPRITNVRSKQFNYTVTSSFRGNVSKTVIDLKTLADRVETQDLQKYGDDLREADRITKGFVAVTRTKANKNMVEQDRTSRFTAAIQSLLGRRP